MGHRFPSSYVPAHFEEMYDTRTEAHLKNFVRFSKNAKSKTLINITQKKVTTTLYGSIVNIYNAY